MVEIITKFILDNYIAIVIVTVLLAVALIGIVKNKK